MVLIFYSSPARLAAMNGSGKSTLFKSIMGFVKPTTGRVLITGCPSEKENMVAYVPQSEEVDWNFLRVWDVVMMGRYGYECTKDSQSN